MKLTSSTLRSIAVALLTVSIAGYLVAAVFGVVRSVDGEVFEPKAMALCVVGMVIAGALFAAAWLIDWWVKNRKRRPLDPRTAVTLEAVRTLESKMTFRRPVPFALVCLNHYDVMAPIGDCLICDERRRLDNGPLPEPAFDVAFRARAAEPVLMQPEPCPDHPFGFVNGCSNCDWAQRVNRWNLQQTNPERFDNGLPPTQAQS